MLIFTILNLKDMSEFDFFDIAVKLYETKKTSENRPTSSKPPVSDTVCQHADIITENNIVICQDCGQEITHTVSHDKEWRYFSSSDGKKHADPNRTQPRKTEEKSIKKDVETMGFSEKIVALADELYSETTNGELLRGDSRLSVIFGCIYRAYELTNNHQPAEPLIAQIGITKKKALKGLKQVSLNATKYPTPCSTIITPICCIKDIMSEFKGSTSQINEVIGLYEKVKNKSTKLNRSRPQSVAAGLVYYWICQKKLKIGLKDFAKKAELTEQTISKITIEVSKILGANIG
jgi:transcription initiation factor TFIIIB Brf1 subunit/transcription initiation factor TFIIB